ncbi:MAG: 30S ribosomal protein S7 [Candidatus Eisenbacteria bacterium]|nr:30S ribosomal protein S7 [Candidatus Eisenbacteria bacterium]
MPRRREVPKRKRVPDPKYGSPLVTRFINNLMQGGKRSVAQKIVYDAMEMIAERSKEDPLQVFEKAVGNVKPMLEVKSRRVGGSTYQVPVEVRPERRTALAFRWIITFAGQRSEHSMAAKLAGEILAAYKKEGAAMKKRDDTHRMAEANKALAHYRF